ncbi:MAG: polyphosphate polymerase domain-containing protein [Herbiconiux sp.]|uniref:polyphosphate polymerase domain-containing protein n=1 Tax=Herbiconiux sp. TaxID=1871186 RepID=UPI0012088A15|nr:polyphosphate polymerase domain-containing protein [Herbiconiux sp.]TAJ48948.1 MAG: polyphosphate polymerase domain-containing protein [Herbiconiux sp.]
MSDAEAASRLATLAPIGLDELIERAALQTRVDRKYVIPIGALPALLDGVDPRTQVLETAGVRDFRYESVYFDTPELTSYWMAARQRRRRFKMRTRSYVDSTAAYLEVKTKGARSATVKDRMEYVFEERRLLNQHGLDYVEDTLAGAGFTDVDLDSLAPTLITRYRRTTLIVPGEAGDSRATIDTHLDWALDDERRMHTPGIVVIETKSGSRASPVDRHLWAHGHRPSTISKYGTGLAALRPELASNKWTRVLTRHFRPDTAPTPRHPINDQGITHAPLT